MDTNPRMHTGICASLYAYGDFSVTNRMHTGNIFTWEIKSCIPIYVIISNMDRRMHMGIPICKWAGIAKKFDMGIPLCIMKLCAYGD